MISLIILALWAIQSLALPISLAPRAVYPSVSNARVIGNVTDPSVSRDSCGSVKFGGRILWVCRDTQQYDQATDQVNPHVVTNTASWSNMEMFGPSIDMVTQKVGAGSTGDNALLEMYGGDAESNSSYYPVLSDECPSDGTCSDGTRWAVWPDSPPMTTWTGSDGSAVAYTWVPKSHLNVLDLLNSPTPYTLYKTNFWPSSDANALPTVSVLNEEFWAAGEIGFGDYGNVVKDGYAYLYGQNGNDQTTLARVFTANVEDRSQYEYYVNGAWTSNMPGYNDTDAEIANAGIGQGTFFWSAYFNSYVWIGGSKFPGATFYISTAPAPEGPWITPYEIYTGTNGDYDGPGAYSCVAQPALLPSSDASENGMYISYTQQWNPATYGAYTMPLVYLTFN